MKILFATVGSTKFPKLVKTLIGADFLEFAFDILGFDRFVIQAGSSYSNELFEENILEKFRSRVEIFDYADSLERFINIANVVISHGGKGSLVDFLFIFCIGSGTIMECLYAGKKLVVVVNTDLLDNHQEELADKLSEDGHLIRTFGTSFEHLAEACSLITKPCTLLKPLDRPSDESFTKLLEIIRSAINQ